MDLKKDNRNPRVNVLMTFSDERMLLSIFLAFFSSLFRFLLLFLKFKVADRTCGSLSLRFSQIYAIYFLNRS